MGVEVKGVKQVQDNLKKEIDLWSDAIDASLYVEGLELYWLAQPLTPRDTGRLRGSAAVTKPMRRVVQVVYGALYAVFVHERTEIFHPIGQAKFLQQPFFQRLRGFKARMRKRIRDFHDKKMTVSRVSTNVPTRPRS